MGWEEVDKMPQAFLHSNPRVSICGVRDSEGGRFIGYQPAKKFEEKLENSLKKQNSI